jgi:N-acetylglucosamine malate deacetylase 1
MSLMQRILVLAPHTDDAELGCGGSIVRLLESNRDVYIAAFSTAEESLPLNASPSTLRDEFFEATRLAGIPQKNVFVYGYAVRRLSYFRQDVLEELVKLRREINPDMVLLPSGRDLHQDHQVVYAEGLRAFKDITVWGYELPWNHITFSAQAFVTLERHHLEAKWRILEAYRSQLVDLGRSYFSWEFIEALARVRGTQVKAEYAEAFEVVRIRV